MDRTRIVFAVFCFESKDSVCHLIKLTLPSQVLFTLMYTDLGDCLHVYSLQKWSQTLFKASFTVETAMAPIKPVLKNKPKTKLLASIQRYLTKGSYL